MPALPIDALIPRILASLGRDPNLVIEAPPGAGKTTRVPPALAGLGPGDVLVLEPRRLAARAAAHRVADELGERVGQTAGYQVRFEEVAGPATRVRYLTEGVLTRRLLSDPRLEPAATVVLDEFHERHLDGDLALALLRRLQRTHRPDLRLVIMSATLEAAPIAEFLGGCPVARAEGRLFDLDVSYTPHSAEPLEERVAAALDRLLAGGLDGDVLVFLPGAREIRRAGRALERTASRAGLLITPLHGDLTLDQQARAILPADRRKVILSTNVAESSVTVEGVWAVIDSGLVRVASEAPWSGLPALALRRISRASAIQRAGRAGRLRPGRVIRLYTEEDFHRLAEREAPEIARRGLAELRLGLLSMGIRDPLDLEWLEPPPPASVAAAGELLAALGAVDEHGRLTDTGREMARYPLHPRLARLVAEAARRGAAWEGCAVAALLSAGEHLPETADQTGPSDLLRLVDLDWKPATRQIFSQLRRLNAGPARGRGTDQAILIATLTAFSDRVARRRQGDDLLLASGGAAVLSPGSVVRDARFLVAVDIEERRERGLPLVRLASAVEPGWLLDLFPAWVSERRAVEWNRPAERVEAVSALMFGEIAIEESRGGAPDPAAAARVLAGHALEAGLGRFADLEEIEDWLGRLAFASGHADLPKLGDQDVRAALEALCQGLASFGELEAAARRGGLTRALEARLDGRARRLLEQVAPSSIRLPSGRHARVRYSAHQPPWISSRLQDFFGLDQTPRVAGGKVPLVLHLLAPNQRPVQTTTDLAGFWQRLYPQLRRELGRRYPKHAWPEDPLKTRPTKSSA